MNVSNARELVALRHHLATHLDPADAAAISWPSVAKTAGPGIDLGWTGADLAATAMQGVYSGGIDSPAAYVMAGLRDLAQQAPPSAAPTPTPPPARDVLTGRQTPASDPAAWAAKVRRGTREASA